MAPRELKRPLKRPLAAAGQSLFGPALPRLVGLMSLLRVARPFASLIAEPCYLRPYAVPVAPQHHRVPEKSALLEAHPLESIKFFFSVYGMAPLQALRSHSKVVTHTACRASHLTRITSSLLYFPPVSRPARQEANLLWLF